MRPDPDRLDWRWHHASAATQLSDAQALGWLSDCDSAVHRAYRFKRTVDIGLWSDDVVTRMAYRLWFDQALAPDRLKIECMLLTGSSIEDIARCNRLTPEQIQRYHDLFFDVLPAIADGATMWVTSRLFPMGPYANVHHRDNIGRMHRIAWMYGPDVLAGYQDPCYSHGKRDLRQALYELTKDYLARMTPLNVMSLSGRGDLDVEVLRIAIDDMNDAIAKKVDEQSGKGSGESIMGFLRGLTVAVADPTEPRNLELPAREPRAAELISSTVQEMATV